jgi:hypothetical protein
MDPIMGTMHHYTEFKSASHPMEMWISETLLPETEYEAETIKIPITCKKNNLQSRGGQHKNTQLKI